jgi:hypothetical protein
VVNMPNRPHIHVGLVALKYLLRHDNPLQKEESWMRILEGDFLPSLFRIPTLKNLPRRRKCTDEADKTFLSGGLTVDSPVLRCSSAPPSKTGPIEDGQGT